MTEEAKPTPSRPDVTKDPIYCILGGTILAVAAPFQLAKKVAAYFTTVPTEDRPGRYPREESSFVLHDVYIGTVKEIVDSFETKLIRAFADLTLAETGGIIPFTGEASLDKQTAVLNEMKTMSHYATPERIIEIDRIRNEIDGYAAKVGALDRLSLQGLVAQWSNRQHRLKGPGEDQLLPEDRVDDLIANLQLLRIDMVERRAAIENKRRAEALAAPGTPAEPRIAE